MSNIGKLWAGKLYGTNTGNLFVEFKSSEGSLAGELRFLDDRFGPVVYQLSGEFDGSTISLEGQCTSSGEAVQVGNIRGTGKLTPEGHLRGEWSSDIGTGGIFHLFPHDVNAEETSLGFPPEQLHTITKRIGALRLYANDVEALMRVLAQDFKQGRVVATYRALGTEVARYAPDFQRDFNRLGQIFYLRLFIQEPEIYGINRFALIELNASGINEIKVQGVQQSWVLGKAEALAVELKTRQKFLITSVQKFGLNINGLIFLLALVLLPDLPIWRRFLLVAVVVSAGAIVQLAHKRYVPNVVIFLSSRKPRLFERLAPQAISWILALTSTLVAAIAYGILKGELTLFVGG